MSSKPPSKDGKASKDADVIKSSGKATKSKKDQLMVDHTYTDYAIINEDDDVRILEEESPELSKPCSEKEAEVREKLKGMTCTYGPMRKNAGGVTQPFPGKLMEVLNRSDLAEIIEWMPHGRAFLVKQPKLFATQVLPRFFKQSKYLSFTRQLNLWGFKRITRGKDMGAYYHEIFLRGRPHLAMRMKRQKIKGTGMKLTPDPDSEPDFYNDYPFMPKLQQKLGPLPPLPAERIGTLHQAGGVDASSHNLLNALKVASSNHQPKMQQSMLASTQLQLHQQQQQFLNNASGGMITSANPDYQRLIGAMNSAMGANNMFSAGTLQQLQQQQQSLQQKQQQLQQVGKAANGLGTANGGYQHIYGVMNQASINPMLAAASQLPPMIPATMLQSGMIPSANHLSSHIAKLAYDDVLLAPGVRKQLGLSSAPGLHQGSVAAGSRAGTFDANQAVKNQLSMMLDQNNGGSNHGQLDMPSLPPPLPPPQTNPDDLVQSASSQSVPSKATKDDTADPAATLTAAAGGGGPPPLPPPLLPPPPAAAAATTVSAPAPTTAVTATNKSKSTTPPPPESEKQDVFGYDNDPLQDALKKVGNDPLQDALQKVHKLDDDAASLQRAKAKILQSMAQSGVDPADVNDDEEKKSAGDAAALDEKMPSSRPSLGRPFVPRNSEV